MPCVGEMMGLAGECPIAAAVVAVVASVLLFRFGKRLHQIFFGIYIRHMPLLPGTKLGNDRYQHPEDLPPPFPNAWFDLCETSELAKGQTLVREALGRKFIITRGADGEVTITDAHQKDRPCPVRELMGFIMVWNHDKDVAPTYDVKDHEIKNLSKNFYYIGKAVHDMNCHIQDLPENGADVAHLNVIHTRAFGHWSWHLPRLTWEWEFIPQDMDAKKPHVRKFKLKCQGSIWGKEVAMLLHGTNVQQIGASMVYLDERTKFNRMWIVQTLTPIGPYFNRMTHYVWVERWMPRILGKAALEGMAYQVDQDYYIWNKKEFTRRPILVKGDGPIMKYRRWFASFYPKKEKKAKKLASADDEKVDEAKAAAVAAP